MTDALPNYEVLQATLPGRPQQAPSAPLREVFCSNCGLSTDEYSSSTEAVVGRCCKNLPATSGWGQDEPEYDEDNEPRSDPNTCGSCGYDRFVVRYRLWVHQEFQTFARTPGDGSSLEIETDVSDECLDPRVDYDVREIQSIRCESCGHECTGSLDYSIS